MAAKCLVTPALATAPGRAGRASRRGGEQSVFGTKQNIRASHCYHCFAAGSASHTHTHNIEASWTARGRHLGSEFRGDGPDLRPARALGPPDGLHVHAALYPIVTAQCRSPTLCQVFYIVHLLYSVHVAVF